MKQTSSHPDPPLQGGELRRGTSYSPSPSIGEGRGGGGSNERAHARRRLIAEARAWLGTPWAPAGAAKGVGANCLGFLVGAARDAGLVDLADAAAPYLGFATPPNAAALLRGLRRHLRPVERDRARPGDVVLFDLGAGLRHIALLSAPGTIIHAHQSKGRVVEHRLTSAPHSAYRIPGLD